MNAESLVECLEKLEPIFIQAGQAALRMQGSVKHYNKLQTENPAIDIVTEADLATQESLLGAMRSTSLVGCRLLAEEDTESVKAFASESNFYLGIDPIDGTVCKRGQAFQHHSFSARWREVSIHVHLLSSVGLGT